MNRSMIWALAIKNSACVICWTVLDTDGNKDYCPECYKWMNEWKKGWGNVINEKERVKKLYGCS